MELSLLRNPVKGVRTYAGVYDQVAGFTGNPVKGVRTSLIDVVQKILQKNPVKGVRTYAVSG